MQGGGIWALDVDVAGADHVADRAKMADLVGSMGGSRRRQLHAPAAAVLFFSSATQLSRLSARRAPQRRVSIHDVGAKP